MNDLGLHRKSHTEIGEIYFWTATINNWHRLLLNDTYKAVIIDSLNYLSNTNKIDVYAFVIMPNHIHLIWRINEMNRKESPKTSFLKHTAHQFKKLLLTESNAALVPFMVKAENKDYEFWQRDSLAILLHSRQVAYQKMDYIHANPLAEHWGLVKDPSEYYYSSASFYETGERRFTFLKDLREEF